MRSRARASACSRWRGVDTVPNERDGVERDLEFVGLAALLDPPRPEVADAVSACHRAASA